MIETAYRKILVPTDGSENTSAATNYAIDMARQIKAEITALSVVDITNYATIPGEPDNESPLYQSSEDAVQRVIEAASALDINANGMIINGIPSRDIVEASQEYDIIVMGTTGRTGMTHLILGSVASKVVRSSRSPVIVIRAGSTSSFKCEKMLIATDGGDSSIRSVRHGLSLAKAFGASVTALCVSDDIRMTVESKLGESRLANAAVNDVIAEGRKLDLKVEPKIISGSPAEVIVEASDEYDILVMGTHGRKGLAHFRLGSVAEAVIRTAKCPVMTVSSSTTQHQLK